MERCRGLMNQTPISVRLSSVKGNLSFFCSFFSSFFFFTLFFSSGVDQGGVFHLSLRCRLSGNTIFFDPRLPNYKIERRFTRKPSRGCEGLPGTVSCLSLS